MVGIDLIYSTGNFTLNVDSMFMNIDDNTIIMD